MDKSNGYEDIATIFSKVRGQSIHGIGASSVRAWVQTMPPGSVVLDLGCGTGIPVARVLFDEGMTVYGIDASPTLINAFQQNFPSACVACESVEESVFFNRKFDGIIAWGLIFLLSKEAQALAIQKAAEALRMGGRFLFTSPSEKASWNDVMTQQHSLSLGADKYKELLSSSGLTLVEEFKDEGENYYFHSLKSSSATEKTFR